MAVTELQRLRSTTLTKQENQIVKLTVEDFSNREIAHKLGLTEHLELQVALSWFCVLLEPLSCARWSHHDPAPNTFHRPASTGESCNGTISAGACPGDDESAGVNYSHRSPKGNRHMRRVLNQTANAAARTKGSIFEIVYRRSVTLLGHNQVTGAIAHRQCRLI